MRGIIKSVIVKKFIKERRDHMKNAMRFVKKKLLPCFAGLLFFTATIPPVSAAQLTPIAPITPITPITPINPAITDLQDKMNYDYTIWGNEVTINKYKGFGEAVTVPSAFDGIPVTKIESLAFSENDKITSVTIPDSVTSIGADAFHKCINLKTVKLPSNLTELGLDAFSDCGQSDIHQYPVKSDINRSMDVFELHQLGKYCYSVRHHCH